MSVYIRMLGSEQALTRIDLFIVILCAVLWSMLDFKAYTYRAALQGKPPPNYQSITLNRIKACQ